MPPELTLFCKSVIFSTNSIEEEVWEYLPLAMTMESWQTFLHEHGKETSGELSNWALLFNLQRKELGGVTQLHMHAPYQCVILAVSRCPEEYFGWKL